jgi:ubiquinone/menaquinone biosynthesis C-methylase UbiE
MKIRESGMPKQEDWDSFFDPKNILHQFGLNRDTKDVVDFGCGYGTFTITASQMISGKIYALDIDADMVKTLERKARELKLKNVEPILRDFLSEGSGLADSSVDFVMLFNILHLDNPTILLSEAYRILSVGGKVGIIHWNYDSSTPRGPPMSIRPKPEQIKKWAESVGFVLEQQFDFKPYHYGFRFRK